MPMFKKSLLILLVLAIAALGGTMYGFSQQSKTEVLDPAAASSTEAVQATVTVYITGAVNKPGVVTAAEGSRIADCVNLAGGLLPTAASDRLNMAQVVKDGQKISVPEKAQNGNTEKSADGNKADGNGNLININTADAQTLDSLPGVGPSTAKKIIEYRESEGNFQDISDLKKIKGIGEAKFAKLKDKICI